MEQVSCTVRMFQLWSIQQTANLFKMRFGFQTSRFQYVVWCVRGCSVLLSHLCMIIHSYIIKLSDADRPPQSTRFHQCFWRRLKDIYGDCVEKEWCTKAYLSIGESDGVLPMLLYLTILLLFSFVFAWSMLYWF